MECAYKINASFGTLSKILLILPFIITIKQTICRNAPTMNPYNAYAVNNWF